MEKRRHLILGVHITDRVGSVPDIQKIFTEYGCYIRTRVGLHDVQGDYCAPGGLILLDMICEPKACQEMVARLSSIAGVEVQQMAFDH
ncbi:MAG: hypothetical protein ACE149_14635 [Armatimonadota bacterium]